MKISENLGVKERVLNYHLRTRNQKIREFAFMVSPNVFVGDQVMSNKDVGHGLVYYPMVPYVLRQGEVKKSDSLS